MLETLTKEKVVNFVTTSVKTIAPINNYAFCLDKIISYYNSSDEKYTPEYGDIIFVKKTYKNAPFKHYGIYLGNNKVIHYHGESFETSVIQEDSLDTFMTNSLSKYYYILNLEQKSVKKVLFESSSAPDSYYNYICDSIFYVWENSNNFINGINYANEIFSKVKINTPHETVKRAKSRLGEQKYSLVTNNCEHFAFWCKTGEAQSKQVQKLISCISDILNNYFQGEKNA